MTKYIACLSAKGGTGKTTSAINISSSLKYFGKDVVLVDGNFTTPNVSIHLGMHQLTPTLTELLNGKPLHISKATYLHPSGIHVVPSSLSLDKIKKINLNNFSRLLDGLAGGYDFVIIDSSAGLGNEALTTLEVADEVLIITNPELPAVVDALKAVKIAEESGKPIRGIVLNKTGTKNEMSVENVEQILEYPVISCIPEDSNMRVALVNKHPIVNVFPESQASLAYKELAASLLGINYKSYKQSELNWWQRLFSLIMKKNKRY